MSALGWKKRDGTLSENEINDGESPLADTPAGPSGVFINSSRIQLVGLFVRRFSLTSPSTHCSFTNSVPLFRPVMSRYLFFHLSLSPPFFSKELRKIILFSDLANIIQFMIYTCKFNFTYFVRSKIQSLQIRKEYFQYYLE